MFIFSKLGWSGKAKTNVVRLDIFHGYSGSNLESLLCVCEFTGGTCHSVCRSKKHENIFFIGSLLKKYFEPTDYKDCISCLVHPEILELPYLPPSSTLLFLLYFGGFVWFVCTIQGPFILDNWGIQSHVLLPSDHGLYHWTNYIFSTL